MRKDLVILVADKNAQFALRGALCRPEALGIRKISFEFRTHMSRDGGVRTTGVDMLACEAVRFGHALMFFDHEGSGSTDTVDQLQQSLDNRLSHVWGDRAKSVVIKPEVDIWVWGADNALHQVLEWPIDQYGTIREWLRSRRYRFDDQSKPSRPKEALEETISLLQRPRSSALYEAITQKISLKNCTDPAFHRVRDCLRSWFGQPACASQDDST